MAYAAEVAVFWNQNYVPRPVVMQFSHASVNSYYADPYSRKQKSTSNMVTRV
jgi:hypothetical protein